MDLLTHTARLWRSLGHHDAAGRFHIDGVTGPDEYSAIADDNVYTNLMARRNLLAAATAAESYPDRARELGIDAEESASWRDAGESMYIPYDEALGVHPQAEGFTSHQVWDFAGTPPDHYPLLLHYPYFDLYRKQVVKQADLVLAMHLCDADFTAEQKARNFAYYEPLTVRDSSLSACTQAVIAAETGHLALAFDYLGEAALMDLRDLEHNTRDGVHIASLAGSWLALVCGFAGLRYRDGRIAFAPRLPEGLTRLAFTLLFRAKRLRVEVTQQRARYQLADGDPMEITHHGAKLTLEAGKPQEQPITPAPTRRAPPSLPAGSPNAAKPPAPPPSRDTLSCYPRPSPLDRAFTNPHNGLKISPLDQRESHARGTPGRAGQHRARCPDPGQVHRVVLRRWRPARLPPRPRPPAGPVMTATGAPGQAGQPFGTLLAPITLRTAGERIAERFVTAIALGEFVPGQRLPPERELAAMLEVSRTTVREALQRLQAAGYVTARRGRGGGTFVRTGQGPGSDEMIRRTLVPAWAQLTELLDFRQLVEQLIARTAAVRREENDIHAIRAAVARYSQAADRDASRLADQALHQAIARAAHNERLAELSARIRREVSFGFDAEPYTPEVRLRATHQHPELAEAVIAGDPERAASLAARHFSLTEEMLSELHARIRLRSGGESNAHDQGQ